MTTTPRTHLAAVPTLDLRDRAPLPDPDALHDCWSSASRARLGLSRQQWHHPATSDLVDALIAGEDLTDALHELGAARAAAGLSLDELLGDLAVLGSLVPRPATTPDFGIDRVDDLRAASVASTAWTSSFGSGPTRRGGAATTRPRSRVTRSLFYRSVTRGDD